MAKAMPHHLYSETVKTVDVQPGQRVRIGAHTYTVMGHESNAWLLRIEGETA